MRKYIIILFSLSALLFSACEKDTGPVIIKPFIPEDTTVNFANDIQPIFNANCIHCHNQIHPFLNLLSCCSWEELVINPTSFWGNYLDTLSPTESYLYIRVAGMGQSPPEMPPGGPYLGQEETDLILKWIQQGAKNN
ncbi:MAG TPA: hypothetical protein VI757_10555 [Bacteroidia bacterium]|nr:hypothetical protein [Bacteroidia bacterium]